MSTPFDPNTAQNLPEIEKQFAVKAVEHAQVYWNLLEKIEPNKLRLTKSDDQIFGHFSTKFADLFVPPYEGLAVLDEDMMKSSEGKDKWRDFHETFKDKVTEHNFGTLIRTNAKGEYSENNTIFVTRLQFYAFEIARNRLGLNEAAHELAIRESQKELEAANSKKGHRA